MSRNKYGRPISELLEGKGKQGRSTEFQKEEGVQESLREQIPKELLKTLKELNIGQAVVEHWNQGNSQRAAWLERQKKLEKEVDEFLDPIYEAPMSWSSTLHYPVILTIGKAYHARMYSAITAVEPAFTVRARREATVEQAVGVQQLMGYTTKDWMNYYEGIDEELDQWCWNWIFTGSAILKARWDKQFVKFKDVQERVEIRRTTQMNPETGLDDIVEIPEVIEEEVDVIKKTFDGPCAHTIPAENLVLIGSYDPQKADAVIERSFFTASDILTLVDRKVFDEAASKIVLAAGRDYEGSDASDGIKHDQVQRAGESTLEPENEKDKYELLEAYIKVSVDRTGIDTDVLVIVHKRTREILRATYLYRIMDTGERPYFKADFHRRKNAIYGSGFPEILYSLAKEIDAVRNMRMDFGLLSTLPFGYYRATSSMSQESIPLEPGQLIPLDDPQSDVFFPNLGNRTVFGFQEEQAIYTMIERYTGTSDLMLGIIGDQGVTRTATGARALVGESNANLNIFLRRIQRPLRQFYKYILAMLQKKLPEGFAYRVLGEDGKDVFMQIPDRTAIAGAYDFELDPNSSNSNPQIQLEIASQIYQLTANPLDLQLGIISPLERYESIKNFMQAMGVKDYSRFVRKPAEIGRMFTPAEIVNRVLSGMDVPLTPDMDIQGFLAYAEEIFSRDEILGQFSEQDTIALVSKIQEAQAMLEALQAQQSQVANQAQQQANAQGATAPGQMPAMAQPQGPVGGGEGG
jgi:hypothetical protein